MEIFNRNKVSVPDLPGTASVKERLAHEVASRIVRYMNMNDPRNFRAAHFDVIHHGGKLKSCTIYIVDGGIEDPHYRSGSKVCEAVLGELSRISRIDRVTVSMYPGFNFGSFSPDSPADAIEGDPRKERARKLKDAMMQLKKERFVFTLVRYTGEVRSKDGKLLHVFGKEYGQVTIAQRSAAQFVKAANDILDDIGDVPGVTVYLSRGFAAEISVEL